MEGEIFWSPFDNEDVQVQMERGVVRLTGTVDSWSERRAAEENARHGGALAVENAIKVLHGPKHFSP